MQDFRKLLAWQKAHRLALDTYAFSATLQHPRFFSLRNQLVRAASSIPANLAEGCGRTGDREMRRFIRVALGSASELEYHLLLARDLAVMPEPDYLLLSGAVMEVKRMLTALAGRLTERIGHERQPSARSTDF